MSKLLTPEELQFIKDWRDGEPDFPKLFDHIQAQAEEIERLKKRMDIKTQCQVNAEQDLKDCEKQRDKFAQFVAARRCGCAALPGVPKDWHAKGCIVREAKEVLGE